MHLRISKYSPQLRGNTGNFIKNDWTSISDIGKTFDGRILTEHEYLIVEDAYWNIVSAFLDKLKVESFQIKELEIYGGIEKLPSKLQEPREEFLSKIRNEMTIRGDEVESIFRLNLREIIWCKLASSNCTYIHFGYDFYVYLGSKSDIDVSSVCKFPNIFIEHQKSPYF